MIDLEKLKPYKSLIIIKSNINDINTSFVNEILDDLLECLEISAISKRQLVNRIDAYTSDDLILGILHYREDCQTSWTYDVSIQDMVNHLVIVCARSRYIAIFLSDPKRKQSITRKLFQSGFQGLQSLEIIPQGLLNAAFVKGPARTLWLTGTHRRTSIKPDNKILTGIDLRDALDPLGDQTYHFTAARCVPDDSFLPQPVGISPRKSQVWTGPSRNWLDFRLGVSKILTQVESTMSPINDPLPVIAVSSPEVSRVSYPFDIAIVPPELLADNLSIDDDALKLMELWGYQSIFEILQAGETECTLEVNLKGQVLGKIRFIVDLAPNQPISWTINKVSGEDGQEEALNEAIHLLQRIAWVKVWFESGHTICDGEIFEIRHRDMPFVDITWADLSGYQIKQEKPEPLNDIGNQLSLFDWMLHYWPNVNKTNDNPGGWLACDDGSMEIADFIHLDDRAEIPVVNLVHVKASGSNDPKRTISVSDYEVVTSQAVKNLRYLDRLLLSEGIEVGIGKKIGKLVWHDRVMRTREDMIEALAKVGANYAKRIFILQPRLTKSSLERARKSKDCTDFARLRQLDTLLLSAAAACKGLGVDLTVIGDIR